MNRGEGLRRQGPCDTRRGGLKEHFRVPTICSTLSHPSVSAVQTSFLDAYPGVWQLVVIAAAGILIALMIRYWRGGTAAPDGFVIRVNGDDISFRGQFPPQMEAMVADFLR